MNWQSMVFFLVGSTCMLVGTFEWVPPEQARVLQRAGCVSFMAGTFASLL